MSLQDFCTYAAAYYAAHPDQRYGQAMFNALGETHPGLAGEIIATDADPYYDNDRLPAFWVYVAERIV